MTLSPDSVRRSLSRINARKAPGPDNIPGRVLRDCAVELTDVFTDIVNISLSQAVVPTCFKATTIIPVPKKSSPSCFNDYRPVALTPILMKCFERCDEWGGAESRGNGARPVELMIMIDTCATHRSRVPRRSSGRIKGGASTVEDERGPGLDFSLCCVCGSRP